MPTDYEVATMTSHSDKNGVFLSLILDKMKVTRDSIYCTDMIKCNSQLDEQSFNECIKFYLNKEIEYVSPKVIVCNGLSVLKTCIKLQLLQDLPLDVTYGKLYDAKTNSNAPIKVIAIYDLDTVLKKTDGDYEKCKTELWTQLLTAFKASV
jgi:uracil-DNA glycosylase family 4